MLAVAGKDLTALKAMRDQEDFSDEIFGFHAQQAVEKALKAWLSLAGARYPKIHDLEELLEMLKAHEKVPPAFSELATLTDYAVQFRYELIEHLGGQIDRDQTIEKITELFNHVSKLLGT